MPFVEVDIYCDESKDNKDEIGNKWNYYGLLIVPKNKKEELFTKLENGRCIPNSKWKLNGCDNHCGYHSKNNTEISYKSISQNHEYIIASNWIELLLENGLKNSGMIYFNILGINYGLIDQYYWKHMDKKNDQMYAKFLCTAIKSIKYFFYNKKVIVNEIIHDQSSLYGNESIYYQNLLRDLKSDNQISFHCEDITYLESDHRKSGKFIESNFIQFIDLILGLTVNYIHYNSKNNEKKVKLTKEISELVRRLINSPRNPNSRYNYHEKQTIQFFPKNKNFYDKYFDLEGEKRECVKHNLFYSKGRTCLFEQQFVEECQSTFDDF